MEDVNIIIGRFQPFTNGHLKCCKEALKKHGLRTVLLVIETTKQDERHPFLTTTIMPSLKRLPKDIIADVLLVKNANIVNNAPACIEAGFQPKTWTCGTDRYADYKKMASKYGDEADLPEDFEVVEVKRKDDDVSATQVRKAIKEGDQELFEELVPKQLWTLYYRLKKDIEEVMPE